MFEGVWLFHVIFGHSPSKHTSPHELAILMRKTLDWMENSAGNHDRHPYECPLNSKNNLALPMGALSGGLQVGWGIAYWTPIG